MIATVRWRERTDGFADLTAAFLVNAVVATRLADQLRKFEKERQRG